MVFVVADLFPFDEDFTRTFYKLGTEVWNTIVDLITAGLTANVRTGSYTAASYSWVVGLLNDTNMQTLAYALLAVFFLFEMIAFLVKNPRAVEANTVIMFYLRLGIAGAVIGNMKQILDGLLDMGAAIAGLAGGSVSYTGINVSEYSGIISFNNALEELGLVESVIMCMVALIYFFLMLAAAFNLAKAVIGIWIDVLAMMPFAGMAVSTMTGGQHTTQVAASYIKSFVGKCLASALIIIIMGIAATMITSIVNSMFSGDHALAILSDDTNYFVLCLKPMLQRGITAMLVTASVSGADMKLKNMGL